MHRRAPFATLKYRIFGNPRFLLRDFEEHKRDRPGDHGYNLKRMINVLGGHKLAAALAG